MTNFHYRLPAMARYWRNMMFDWIAVLARGDEDVLRFRCNICGRRATAPLARITREESTCRCGSSVRLRALVHVLSLEMFGKSHMIKDMPYRPDLVGIDMSGASVYAERLVDRLGYVNTFLHKPPRLDITDPGPEWLSHCDFVISSDVFEHVAPPVARAFANVLKILKPGGAFIFTVPYTREAATLEHFPELHDYTVEKRGTNYVLTNITRDGQRQLFDDLVFHGGEGETLEMRVFCESDVVRQLEDAGFVDIRIHREECPQFGILWPHDWSLPISARRPHA